MHAIEIHVGKYLDLGNWRIRYQKRRKGARAGWWAYVTDASLLATSSPRTYYLGGKTKAVIEYWAPFSLQARATGEADSWPPRCPTCDGPMNVRRQRSNGSNLPFFSCVSFPQRCRGRRDFSPHPDDLATTRGDEQQALYLSLERARADGLVVVAVGAQRRARRREVEQAGARR